MQNKIEIRYFYRNVNTSSINEANFTLVYNEIIRNYNILF